jgi:acetate kinase
MALGGCDVLIFTGGIGRNSATVRSKSLKGAKGLGFVIDEAKNGTVSTTPEYPVADISAASSRVKILVVRTFEELMMARQCAAVVEKEFPTWAE